jgi:hypothetical protein
MQDKLGAGVSEKLAGELMSLRADGVSRCELLLLEAGS